MTHHRFISILGLAVASVASAHGQTRATLQRAMGDGQFDLPWSAPAMVRAKSLFNAGADKVDPALLAVAKDVQSKGIGNLDTAAEQFGVSVEDDRMAVTLVANSEQDTDALAREVRSQGGRVTVIYGNTVFAL